MVYITAFRNPLSSTNERSTLDHGRSYREIIDTLGLGRNVLLASDGLQVSIERWDDIARDESFINVWCVPGLTVGAVVLGTTAIIAGLIAGDMINQAVFHNESYLNKFFALFRAPKTGDMSMETRPGISGASNSLNKYGPVPVILGTHYIAPFWAGNPYSEIAGTDGVDQFVHLSFLIAYGPLSVGTIRLGENLLATNTADVRTGEITVDGNYNPDDVEIEIRQDATDMTYYSERVTENQFSGGMEMRSPAGVPTYLYATSSAGAVKIEVDFECPNGVDAYNDDGDEVGTSLEFKADYRVAGSGGAWTNFYDEVFTDKKLKMTGRYTGTKTGLTAGTYEVRAYRVTADSNSDLVRDDVYWTALRSTLDMPPVRPAISAKAVRMSMRIRAGTAISGSVSKINMIASSIIPVYDGSGTGADDWASTAITANPAAQALYVLRGAANPKPVSDANIDWPAFEALYTWCETLVDDGASGTEKRNQCNALIDSQDKGIDVLTKILLTCRASITRYGNIISVIHDTVKTTPVGLITARNSWGYAGSKAFADIPHGYRIRFVNAAANYQEDECIVLRDGYVYDTYNDGVTRDAFGAAHTTAEYYEGTTYYILATELESIERWGVTNHSMLWREGRYELAKLVLRSEVHSVKQSVEAVISYSRGTLIRLGHDVPLFGIPGGMVKTVTLDGSSQATAFIGDELLPMETGKAYGIRYQRVSDGRVLWGDLTAVVGTAYGYAFSTAIAAADVPAAGDQFWFGEVVDGTPNDTAEEIVVGIEPGEDLTATIYLQDYAPGVHTADTGTMPEFQSHLTLPVARNFGASVSERTAAQTAASQAVQSQMTAIAAAAANTTTKATKFDVTSSVAAFTKNRAGTVAPASVTFAGFSIIAGIQSAYAGRFKVYESTDGTTWGAAAYTSSGDEDHTHYSSITAKIAAVRCELYEAGGVTVLLDTITIPVAYNESTAPMYLGIGVLAGLSTMAFTGATVDSDGDITAGSSVANIITGDWMVNYDSTNEALGIYYWSGTAWILSSDYRYIPTAAIDLCYLNVGAISVPGYSTFMVAIIKTLFTETIIVLPAGHIESDNFVTGSSGYSLNETDAEFNDVTVRGTIRSNFITALSDVFLPGMDLTKTDVTDITIDLTGGGVAAAITAIDALITSKGTQLYGTESWANDRRVFCAIYSSGSNDYVMTGNNTLAQFIDRYTLSGVVKYDIGLEPYYPIGAYTSPSYRTIISNGAFVTTSGLSSNLSLKYANTSVTAYGGLYTGGNFRARKGHSLMKRGIGGGGSEFTTKGEIFSFIYSLFDGNSSSTYQRVLNAWIRGATEGALYSVVLSLSSATVANVSFYNATVWSYASGSADAADLAFIYI
jgi:hypothetical protein